MAATKTFLLFSSSQTETHQHFYPRLTRGSIISSSSSSSSKDFGVTKRVSKSVNFDPTKMIFRRVLLVTVAVSCLAVAGCQDDKKDDGDKDPVGPATLATPTALFKCDEVSQAEFQSRNEVLFKFGFCYHVSECYHLS